MPFAIEHFAYAYMQCIHTTYKRDVSVQQKISHVNVSGRQAGLRQKAPLSPAGQVSLANAWTSARLSGVEKWA